MKFIEIDCVDSTNSYLTSIAGDATHGTVVLAREQTAGRGQRGNSWEAESGANITLSILLKPQGIHPARQFVISQAVSLAIVETLDRFLDPDRVHIKWPNDIYVDDRKICGILIENAITSTSIERSIAGIGLNVNQLIFRSDAPNPVSLRQLIPQREFSVTALARDMAGRILDRIDRIDDDTITPTYFSRLWRNDGYFPYHDNVRDTDMLARITAVAPSGHITLSDKADGSHHTYAFKEITFTL